MDKKIMIIGLLAAMLVAGAGGVVALQGYRCNPWGLYCFAVGVKSEGGSFRWARFFDVNDDVYVEGYAFPNGPVDIYIIGDGECGYGCNLAGKDVTGNVETATVSNYKLDPVKVWSPTLTVGKYDIIVDTDRDGILDWGDSINSFYTYGIEVVPELSTMTLMGVGLVSMIGYVGVRRIRGV